MIHSRMLCSKLSDLHLHMGCIQVFYLIPEAQLELTRAFTSKNAKFDSELNKKSKKKGEVVVLCLYKNSLVQNPDQT